MATKGNGNSFPQGQCTWWASQRYHQLTGIYPSWHGDAWSWAANARASGWTVSSTPPPNGTPAIAVLQPNVQGAGGLGHVAVVESSNLLNGTVTTSGLNWAGNQVSPTQVTFRNGAGVLYAYYPGAARLANAPGVRYGVSALQAVGSGSGSGTGTPTTSGNGQAPSGNGPTPTGTFGQDFNPNQNYIPTNASGNFGGGPSSGAVGGTLNVASGLSGGTVWLPLLAQVHNTLVTNQGFYAIALAVDEAEQFPGWVNLASGPTDFIGVARSVGASFADNFPPVVIRGMLILMGVAIVTLLVLRVAIGVGEQAAPIIEGAAKVAAL